MKHVYELNRDEITQAINEFVARREKLAERYPGWTVESETELFVNAWRSGDGRVSHMVVKFELTEGKE